MSLSRLCGQTALVSALLALPAFTGMARAETTTDLQEIVVDSEGDPNGSVNGIANPATRSGSKMAAKITEIPQSVSVIGAEELESANANKVDGALAYTAGVQTQPYGNDSDTNWFFVRGFAATATGAFIDGLPSYSYGFGGFYVDPAGLERIEVLRGPASALYGAANPGGIINMVSKRPTGKTGGTDTLGIDETGRVWAQTDREGVLKSGAEWRFVGKLERNDENGVFEPGNRIFLAPSLKFALDSATEVVLSASYTRMDEDHVGGSWLPYIGTVEAAPFGFIDRDFNSGEPALDSYRRDQLTFSSEITHTFDNGWDLVSNTRFGWSDVEESSVYAFGYAGYSATPTDADNTLSRVFFQHDTESKTALTDLRLENEFTSGAIKHKMMFGVDAKYFNMDQVQGAIAWPGAATGLSANNPVYGAAQLATTPYADNIVDQTQIGIYAQDQMRWGAGWIATLNLRHDMVKTTVSEDRTSGAAGSERSDGKTTWRLGLAKEFEGGLTAYASTSSYFNPQVVSTSAGNGIGPETGRQAEIGLKYSPDKNTLLTFSLFDMDRNHISQSVWNGGGYDYFEIGSVNSRGAELEIQHDFGNGLKVAATATKMDVKVTDDVNTAIIGKTPYSTVDTMATLQVDYTLPSTPALTLTGGLRYIGKSWADNANTLEVPAVTLIDAGVKYDLGNDWTANLAVTNLTDETFVSACQTGLTCYYGEGRRASLSISHKF